MDRPWAPLVNTEEWRRAFFAGIRRSQWEELATVLMPRSGCAHSPSVGCCPGSGVLGTGRRDTHRHCQSSSESPELEAGGRLFSASAELPVDVELDAG